MQKYKEKIFHTQIYCFYMFFLMCCATVPTLSPCSLCFWQCVQHCLCGREALLRMCLLHTRGGLAAQRHGRGCFSQSFQFAGVIYWYRFRCRHINLLLLLMAVARPIVIRKSAEQYTYTHTFSHKHDATIHLTKQKKNHKALFAALRRHPSTAQVLYFI